MGNIHKLKRKPLWKELIIPVITVVWFLVAGFITFNRGSYTMAALHTGIAVLWMLLIYKKILLSYCIKEIVERMEKYDRQDISSDKIE